ncbi:MAG: Alpha-D-kanosaminyltransferase [Pedosphaera sp.]|nr:Alpha-D-kanosaminyltransferase [Pedosphaera sp.]
MRQRVLMIAYACNPKGSGEHWLGWGWAEQAARAYQVDLITTTNSQKLVEERARECGITPHFVTLPEWLKKLTSHLGGTGSWLRKIAWQFRVAKLAAKLHQKSPFALVHQTTFHTFRVPFLAQHLAIPSVWGPVAGGESVPPGFSQYLGKAKFSESSRRLINKLWLHFPPVKKSLQRASVIFVSNRTTLEFLPRAVQGKCQIVPPNALRPEDEKTEADLPSRNPTGATLHLLYVGNCVATRAIPLVFDALIQSKLQDYKFVIIGDGPALNDWKQQAVQLGLANHVEFTGKVPYEKLPAFYQSADALVFPALRDSGGSALLEAMSRQIPVICLDWAGPGEMVDDHSGIKIPVDNPGCTVKALGEAFSRLKSNPGLGNSLARAAFTRSQSVFRWSAKFELLKSCYERLITKQ